jgi:hypothetical protein
MKGSSAPPIAAAIRLAARWVRSSGGSSALDEPGVPGLEEPRNGRLGRGERGMRSYLGDLEDTGVPKDVEHAES